MKKKDRSPEITHSSPNPRPKRRNKKHREQMPKQKKQESPTGTPIQTPIQTPDRPTTGNSFDALQPDSDAEDEKSVETVTADDPNVEIKSINSEISMNQTSSLKEIAQSNDDVTVPAAETPDDLKQRSTRNGPIAQILPTDNERLGTSIPLFASQLAVVNYFWSMSHNPRSRSNRIF
jgi:hypothetical protein